MFSYVSGPAGNQNKQSPSAPMYRGKGVGLGRSEIRDSGRPARATNCKGNCRNRPISFNISYPSDKCTTLFSFQSSIPLHYILPTLVIFSMKTVTDLWRPSTEDVWYFYNCHIYHQLDILKQQRYRHRKGTFGTHNVGQDELCQ